GSICASAGEFAAHGAAPARSGRQETTDGRSAACRPERWPTLSHTEPRQLSGLRASIANRATGRWNLCPAYRGQGTCGDPTSGRAPVAVAQATVGSQDAHFHRDLERWWSRRVP